MWNKITRAARGLILDGNGQIVARPFDKFFNMFERHESEPKNFPKCGYTIEEKLDGSLGIVFWNPILGAWDISTRGSLRSDQANHARTELLGRYDWSAASKRNTYCTEIIYPDNKIVLDYDGWSGLRLLAIRHNTTGFEVPAGRIPIVASQLEMKCRETYPSHWKFEDLPMSKNMEGYVIRFNGPDTLRVKVKNPWYLHIHKCLDARSIKNILTLVEGGEWRAFWDNLPKELQVEFDDIYGVLRTMMWDVNNRIDAAWKKASDAKLVMTGRGGRVGRRDFAVWLNVNIERELIPAMFSRLDGHDTRHHMFNIVKRELKES